MLPKGSGELPSIVGERLTPGKSGVPGDPGGSRSMDRSWDGSIVDVCVDFSSSYVRK